MNGKSLIRKAGIRSLVSCAAAVLLIGAGAARAGLFDDDVARKMIADEQKRVTELQQRAEALDARVGRIEESLKSQALLDLFTQIEALKQELKLLRGQLEVLGNNIEGIAKRQRDMYVDLDTRLRRLEQPAAAAPAGPVSASGSVSPGAASPAPAGAGTAGPAAKPAGAPASGADAGAEHRAYEAAHEQRRIGNYQGAIVAFRSFVAQYPKSALASRAQYWIGDSYYNLRDFRNAIASQQKLIAAYPASATVPDAMLNIASSQLELGEAASARKTMDELVARFPLSEAAEKAKRRLATLR